MYYEFFSCVTCLYSFVMVSFEEKFLFFILFMILITFWLHWVFSAVRRLSLVVVSGHCSSVWSTGLSQGLLLLQSDGSGCASLEPVLSSCIMWAQ